MTAKRIITCGQDGSIKIWSYARNILRDIEYSEPFNAIIEIGERIYVGHSNKVSKLKIYSVEISEEETQKCH